VCIDKFGLDGYRAQGDIGVTDILTMPWVFEGIGFDAEIGPKKDAIKKFGDEIISKISGAGHWTSKSAGTPPPINRPPGLPRCAR
jgi:hypothetical protein